MRRRSEQPQREAVGETASAEYVNGFWRGDKVVFLRREEDGRVTKHEFLARYECHLRAEDFTPELEAECRKARALKGFQREGQWVRLSWMSRDLCRLYCASGGYFDRHGIQTYEADLHPVRRHLVETGCGIQKPRTALLDLETDSRVSFSRKEEARILAWTICDLETGELIQGCLAADTDAAETILLEDLFDELMAFDQIATWDRGMEFDSVVLAARVGRHGVRVELRRWLWVSQLEVFRKFNVTASESGDEKASMALGRVAPQVLGKDIGKDDFDASKTYEAWAAGGVELERMLRYNRRDVQLQYLIEQKTGYLGLLVALCQSCGLFPDHRGMHATAFVEAFLLRLARRRDLHFRTHYEYDRGERMRGGFVMNPTRRGIVRGVHVCDFSSLYPSIIQSWNLSPDTHVPGEEKSVLGVPSYAKKPDGPPPPGTCRAPITHELFRTEPVGLLAEGVTEIKRLRKYWSDLQASYPPKSPEWIEAGRRSAGFKIVANSFFGVASSPFSRFYLHAVGESITQGGVWLIKKTIEAAEEKWGMRCIGGDTDSAFVTGVDSDRFRSFAEWCGKELYPPLLRELGCPRNEISLAYEKEFSLLVVVAKKRYAGRYAHYKGKAAALDAKPEIKGLEYKRGDSIRLAREMQEELIEKLLLVGQPVPEELPYTADDFVPFVMAWRDYVLRGELTLRDVTVSKSLSRPLGSYSRKKKMDGSDASLPVHVEVALRLRDLGFDTGEGTRIEYVVVDASRTPQKAIPVSEYEPGCEDRYYLWESLVFPPSQRVLEACFPEHQWRRYLPARPRVKVAPGQLALFGDAPPAPRPGVA